MPLENLAVMAIALGAGGFVKGATGMGLPIVALPVLAAFLDVPRAVAIVCVTGLVTNTWQVWRFRADLFSADFLPRLLTAGAIGIAAGTWLLTSLPERALSILLAALLFGYVALRLTSPHFTLSRPAGRKLAPVVGLAAGVLQGATGISSPVGVTFIHAHGLSRTAHVFAVSAMFLLFSAVQLPVLAIAGILDWPLFLQGLAAVAPALAMMPVGALLAGRVSQTTFDRLILALLTIVAVELVIEALG